MATLSEILKEMNDDVRLQFLGDCTVKVQDKKRTMDTEITFATGEVNCNSFYNNEKAGIVIWVDPEKYNEAIKKLNKVE
ncbi:hypothetical protein [Vibrio phage vB_VaM_H2]|nr:hypothetical protein [Vibrio phage vB_VaM_H2]